MTGQTAHNSRKAVLERMLAEKLTLEEMAERLKIHVSSVRRSLQRHKLNVKKPRRGPLTAEERAWIRVVGDEGMIANWIAETVGCSVWTVQRILGPRPEEMAEWQSVWQEIRRSEQLYWEHHSVAPPAGRGSFVLERSTS